MSFYTPNIGSTVEVGEIESLAKGTLIVGDGTGAPASLAVGSNGKVLKANSGAATGTEWGSAGSGDLLSTNNLSDVGSAATSLSNLGGIGDITGENLSTLSDVTITGIASGEVLKWNGSAWINNTLAELGVSATGHSHTESDISDLQSYITDVTGDNLSALADVTIASIASGELLKWTGAAWENNTLAEAGVAAASHVHATGDITSGTMADARIAESNVTQHVAAIDHDSTLNFAIGEHRIINDSGTSATELWSASKINTVAGTKLANVSEDSTPGLGGDLDVITSSIVSTSNRDVAVKPHGTGEFAAPKDIMIQIVDHDTDCAVGDGEAFFHLPPSFDGMNLVGIEGSVATAGTTGTMDIQIYNVTDTTDVLSTKLTIDSAETQSTTAAADAVINAAEDDVDSHDVWRVDIDAVHTTPAKGLTLWLKFILP